MKIVSEKTTYYKYAFEYEFSMELLEFCRWIKSSVGWKEFSYSENGWRFNSIAVADIIKAKYPEVEIEEAVSMDWKKYLLRKAEEQLIEEKANQLKTKITSDLEIKGLKMDLYDYQKVGVEFFINNNGKAILADTMGLGKSAQALAYLVHQKVGRTLVVCPASVKFVWENEVKKWTHLKPFVFDSTFFRNGNATLDVIKEHDVFIINYDIVKRFLEPYGDIRWDCLIADEFHYLKNSAAQRTKLVRALGRKIPRILLLSGTPLLSRPVELFNGLQMMDSTTWNNWREYTIKYCKGHDGFWGWDARGASNIPELQKRISRYFLRRTKEEVLKELPPKQFVDIPIEMSPEHRFEYDLAISSFMEYLRDIKQKSPEEMRRSLQAEKLVRLGELRQITTKAKTEMAEETIQNVIDGGEKLIVFSCYNEPLQKLHEKFEDISVLILGDTPSELRSKMVDVFQNKDKVKIFFGGIKSAGVGITLTAASSVLFLDYSWVPADHEQAADRCHRIGQKAESITIYQLYAKKSIDEKMKILLENKKLIFNQLFGEQVVKAKSSSLIDDLIKEIQKDELST